MNINMLKALSLKYEGEALAAQENLRVYMTSPAGIGEHSDIVDAVDVQVRKYTEAKEMLDRTNELLEMFIDG